jgi:beta-phosphoglucomutase
MVNVKVHFPQAVFFDFDGVLVESSDIKTEAFLELFSQYPEHREAIHQHHLQNMGVSRFRKFEWIYNQLLQRPVTPEELQDLSEAFSGLVMDKILKAPDVPGARPLLNRLTGNCLCFIASGTPEEELQHIVMNRGINRYFKEICGTPRTKIQIVQELLQRYSLDPAKSWFIGDASTDFEAAVATGLRFIARNTEAMNAFWAAQPGIALVNTLDEVKELLPADGH